MTRGGEPQRRGEALRRHILFSAKELFLEVGFERATMDAVAERASTSKRSLYAYFSGKDHLLLAALGMVRELYLDRLRTPADYAAEPAEAVTLFCGRFLQLMLWETQVRTSRLVIAEAERLPDSARAYHDAVFASTHRRLADYLAERCPGQDADALAEDLLGRTVLPSVLRALLQVTPAAAGDPDPARLARDVDLEAIRRVVGVALPR